VRDLRSHRLALSLPALSAFFACGPVDSDPVVRNGDGWEVTPLTLSALEGGGMPHLSPLEDGGVILSWLAPAREDGAPESGEPAAASERLSRLRAVRYDLHGGFGEPRTVVERDDFFVNWADFPSVIEVAPGGWVAHWLQRGPAGGYDYGVRIAESSDGGESWGPPSILHEDRSPTEHGFVTVWPDGDGGWGAVWLDGRKFADGEHGPASDEMTLRARTKGVAAEAPDAEQELDGRICDCCQTDAALTDSGPVIVYRDRSPEEVRDIHVVRWDQGWTPPQPVHRDGWVIPGCPVNGPAVDARSNQVAVAWFAAPGEDPRVQVAFSGDGGATFGPPTRIDDGRPLGRTDVVLVSDGSAVVLWLEETGNGNGELRLRRAYPHGSLGPSHTLSTARSARASGFPQLLPLGDGERLFAAWTEASDGGPVAVRVAQLENPR